ncbi:serine hydrolase domain-containing protein [Actinomadura oligospora]|uniref:serine hydrolase domain-containing protein n=1 Tax=Actinomadura oligospora TaxID=111804 RepID=UPI0004B6E447|nr:serine hydrolase domain-containing protein [Actinomadura oligospora]
MRKQPGHRSSERKSSRRARAAAAVAVSAITLGVLASPATAATRPHTIQQGLDDLVRTDGVPAALATVQDGDGRSDTYTAGVGDLSTGSPVPVDGQVRIGSNTKTFTAVVMLQLAGERKIRLDAPVDTYLPGVVRGDGIDGRVITVRQLLQHTSGLPNYVYYLSDDVRYYAPRDLLGLALQHKADFAPGTGWKYSNTNYVLAGLIIEKVTGHPIADEITRRVIDRIGLRHTYFPAAHELTIREAHAKGYDRASPDVPYTDVTNLDPSWGWAAGQMVSTNSDLNRFFTALLAGRLLRPAQLAQMRHTVPAGAPFAEGSRYGLGLVSTPLSCGGVYWGHGGSTTGYETRGGVTKTLRAANIAVTTQPGTPTMKHAETVIDQALCR